MVGKVVKLAKSFHVVCDGKDHWVRTAVGFKFESKRVIGCDCPKPVQAVGQNCGTNAL